MNTMTTPATNKLTALDIIKTKPWRRTRVELMSRYLASSSYRAMSYFTAVFSLVSGADTSEAEQLELAETLQRDFDYNLEGVPFIRGIEMHISNKLISITTHGISSISPQLKRSNVDHSTMIEELYRVTMSISDVKEPSLDNTMMGRLLLDAVMVIDPDTAKKLRSTQDTSMEDIIHQVRWMEHINKTDVRGKRHQQGRAAPITTESILELIHKQVSLGSLSLVFTKHAIILETSKGYHNISRPFIYTK